MAVMVLQIFLMCFILNRHRISIYSTLEIFRKVDTVPFIFPFANVNDSNKLQLARKVEISVEM